MKKRVVLFDFDGVIADTEESNAAYLEKALGDFGIVLTDEDRRVLIGTNDKAKIGNLLSRAPGNVTLDYLGVNPQECIVFEDSPVGISAAKQAGAWVAAYRGAGITQNVGEADCIVDSYDACKEILDDIL